MAKKNEETSTNTNTEVEVAKDLTKWEFTAFLKSGDGVKTCLKAVGDSSVLDDGPAVVKHFLELGFKPDSFGGGNGNGGGNPPVAAAAAPGERPNKFQDASGNTWYVNQSKFKSGEFYIGRKNSQTGGYDKMDWSQAPEFIRKAYGK